MKNNAYLTLSIEDSDGADADFTSAAYEVRNWEMGALVIKWDSLDATDGTLIIEGANTKTPAAEDWACEHSDACKLTLDSASGTQQYKFHPFTTRYIRLVYTANSNTAGTISWSLIGF